MEYPRALLPWAKYLSVFPRELSLALAPMVQRVALAIGAMRSRTSAKAGEVDGFDGIARRGVYERLVASEWMLADEMPDEFARRAVMNEHLFLELARREPAAARVSLALFDAGANQLGAPRIAHLALLIALARRAEAAGAQFSWGIVQQPKAPLLQGFSASLVVHLIAARSPHEATEAGLLTWRERVSEWQAADDLWLIGGARLARFEATRGFSTALVRDDFEPEANRLIVSMQGISRPAKSVTLELPDERACARLLRDPFEEATAAPVHVKSATIPASNLVWSGNETYLFARSTEGRIIGYPVPNSPRAGRGTPKIYRSMFHTDVIAVSRFKKSIAFLSAKSDRITVEFLHHNKDAAGVLAGDYEIVPASISFAPLPDSSRLHAGLRFPNSMRSVRQVDLFVLDGQHSLFRLRNLKEGNNHLPNCVGSAERLARDVLAVGQLHNQRIIFLGREAEDDCWRMISVGDDMQRRDLSFTETPTRAFFGYRHGVFGDFAIEANNREWRLFDGWSEESLNPLFDSQVVGVGYNPSEFDRQRGLVVLESDRRTFALRNLTTHIPIHTAAAAVEQVTLSPSSRSIAYATSAGEVVVYSIVQKEVLCRYWPEEKP